MTRTCNTCNYFRSTKFLSGKCVVEPKDMVVSSDRPACRHYCARGDYLKEHDPSNGDMILTD